MSPMLGERTFTRRRYAATTRDGNGRPVDGLYMDSSIRGVIQDLSFTDLQALGYGDRDSVRKYFMTTYDIRTVSLGAGLPADHIVDGELVYEVQNVARMEAVLPHYEAVLALLKEE